MSTANTNPAMLSSRIVKHAQLKEGAAHGMCPTHKNQINADLFAFIKGWRNV
jgi:non-heme chloroperoxidase